MAIKLEDFKGKIALITGSGRSLGRVIALTLAKRGADVVINYNESAEESQRVYSEVIELQQNVITIKADVSKEDEVINMFSQIRQQLGPVEILVNNAGITTNVATVIKMPEENWNKELAINLSGAFYCTKQVLPDMVARKWGRIINISSGAGTMGGFGQCSYSY